MRFSMQKAARKPGFRAASRQANWALRGWIGGVWMQSRRQQPLWPPQPQPQPMPLQWPQRQMRRRLTMVTTAGGQPGTRRTQLPQTFGPVMVLQ